MIVDHIAGLERALGRKGFPPLSPWWLDTITRFYGSGRRQLVLRVGRRGGKSSTLCRVAVLEALYGQHTIPPGDLGVVAIVSVSRDEAAKRLRTIVAILDALGVAHKPLREGTGIELVSRPVAFQTFAATIAGVSGPTCIGAIADEAAKWRDADTGANPAAEVLASLRPTMATQPHARLFLSSSPVSTLDAHYDAFEAGDTAHQMVAHAPTWTANPSVSEPETHALEPDARVWGREYAAIPASAASAVLDQTWIDAARAPRAVELPAGPYVMTIDASNVSARCEFAYAISAQHEQPYSARYETHEGGRIVRSYGTGLPIPRDDYEPVAPYIRVHRIGGFGGATGASMSAGTVVKSLAQLCRQHGIREVVGDQRDAYTLAELFSREKLTFRSIAWTSPLKADAAERLRSWFREGMIQIPDDDRLNRQLAAFSEKFTASGGITYGARGNGQDDRVATLMTLAMNEFQAGGIGQREPFRGMGQHRISPY